MEVDLNKQDVFGDLLHDAENLVAEIDGLAELPRVLRSVSQMVREGSQLWTRTAEGAPSREQADVQAAILLGSKGFDLPKLSQRIDTLSSTRSYGPLEQIEPTDIEGFLRNERQNALLALIADTGKHTEDGIENFVWLAQKERWEKEKEKVLSSIEISADATADQRLNSFNDSLVNWSNISASGLRVRDSSRIGVAGVPCGAPLSQEELKYAKALSEYNKMLISGGAVECNPVDKLGEVAEQLDLKDVTQLWKLLSAFTSVNGSQERRALVPCARRFLERKHLQDIRSTVYGNLNKAGLGGVPGTLPIIRGYLNVKPPLGGVEDDVRVEGHPAWAVIYHCLRCGDWTAAQQVAIKANMPDVAGRLLECARSPQNKLNEHSAMEVKLRYMRELGTGDGGDPYKRAVLAVIARCDVASEHTKLATSIEDYIWLKLCKVDLGCSSPTSSDSLSLSQLQTLLSEDYGEPHFDAYNKPLQYAYILLLTGQLELSIEFLFRTDALKCHAVHMAIALSQMGVLRVTVHSQEPLLQKDPRGTTKNLNLARLITSYTRRFELCEPEMTLEYYFVLRDGHEQLYTQCVTELVLETKAFEKLVGFRKPDGGLSLGALDKFLTDRAPIVEAIAEASEARGLNVEAVSLYDVAGRQDKCIRLLCKLLSQLVTQAGPPGSKRDTLQKLAVQVATRCSTFGSFPSEREKCTLGLLMELMTFFDLYHNKKNEEALALIRQLQLIPLSPQQVDSMVLTFGGQSEEVRRVLPEVLMALMTILGEQYRTLKRSGGQNGSRNLLSLVLGGNDSKLELIKSQANGIIKYAGMIPYRLPANINAMLIQMEANMA